MTFVQIETRNGMVNLDGYSRNKTLKGALKDLAREVAKIDEGEAHAIADYIDETIQMVADGMANEAGAYYIEAEEVPCASRYKFLNGDENDFSEENVKIQYAEGHWYLYIRFCAPEQEREEQEAEQTASLPGASQAAPAAADAVSSLTEEEIKFFNDTVARIKYSVNVHVPIEIMNHDNLTGKHKEALGICWAEGDETGKPVPFRITIDEYFVHECFVALERPFMKLEPQNLEQVIAHEIAHLHIWRHGKKHTELTERICRLIEKGKPHGLDNDIAFPTRKTGQVAMAAMQPTTILQQATSSTIEVFGSFSGEEKRFFNAQYPHHNFVGFLKEAYGGSDGKITRIILKMKPGYKGWTPYGTARDCGDHYIIARYSQYDRVDKKTLTITKDVDDR